jgi:hypothetical protein
MLRAIVLLVQMIMTEFNGTVLEDVKMVVITITVLNLMEQNDR